MSISNTRLQYSPINRSINVSINGNTKRREVNIISTVYSGTHWKDIKKVCINRTDGCKNRQNTIPTIPAITIPTIPAIHIAFHQQKKALIEGTSYIKGGVPTGHMKNALIGGTYRRERLINSRGGGGGI